MNAAASIPAQPSAPRRVGVVGLGAISQFYLAAINASPTWELAAVCDVAQKKVDLWHGHVACFTDHRTMLREAAGALDAVIIAAPNDAHAELVGDALRAGLPVCVEKPLARTVAEGEELADLARRTGQYLFTAFHRRYNTAVLDLARTVTAAAGPPVRSVVVRYLERIEDHMMGDRWYLDPARCGGGCVADNGPNAFDLVRLLIGDVTVQSAEIRRDAAGVDRSAVVRLAAVAGKSATARSTDSGTPPAQATVELDWSYPGEVKDVTVELADRSRHTADMLAGHEGFKQSLWHEYEAIIADFAIALDGGPARHRRSDAGGGLPALHLVDQAYAIAANVQRTDAAPSTSGSTGFGTFDPAETAETAEAIR